jgi:hypothetical protein
MKKPKHVAAMIFELSFNYTCTYDLKEVGCGGMN